jgi:hypothetical protein
MARHSTWSKAAAVLILGGLLLGADDGFVDRFDVPTKNLTSTGRNPYFILEPGYQMTLKGLDEGKSAQLIITVLDETRMIDGVETRVVEERESAGDALVEVSRNFFAIDPKSQDVYYFGEDVDMYEHGKVAGHGGSWQSGKDGAKFGLFIPGHPKVGQKFYQELAPKIAMDRVEIVSMDEVVATPEGEFKHCLKSEETTPLEPGVKEYKLYAPGVGLLRDGNLKLAKHGPMSK